VKVSLRAVLMLVLPALGALTAAAILPRFDAGGGPPAPIRFAVIADPHLYDPALGLSGPAFEAALAEDAKLLAHGPALLAAVTERLLATGPRPAFLLVAGDLTKDGELDSHRLAAAALDRLADAGIPVYVVPGNHDIANPEAARYHGTRSTPVAGLDAAGFARLYARFGYAGALARDPHSLSYVADPAPGYRLLAIDSCRYGEGAARRIDAGRLRPETLAWLVGQLRRARAEGRTVLAMMHHGLVEHMVGQGEHVPELLVDDWDTVARTLAGEGLKLVFTGHGHSQDITRRDWDGQRFLVDVQTGSLVSYPNPYRVVSQDGDRLAIRSHRIDDLATAGVPDGPGGFAAFAREFGYRKELDLLARQLAARSSLSAARRAELAPMLADALLANHAGDELPTVRTFRQPMAMAGSKIPDEAAVGGLMMAIWHDLPPADNDLDLVLQARPAGATGVASRRN
jgi:3',5'-cyclic AMP phosphodiesterase CpdA